MISELLGKCKDIIKDALEKLEGKYKRIAYAQMAKAYGRGGQSIIAKEMNVGRDTIRKGMHELKSGIGCKDAFNMRGRRKATDKLPNLAEDIKSIIDPQSQTDPTFKSTKLYTRLTIDELRKQLIKQKGYEDSELPTNQTFNSIVNNMNYKLKKVQKTKPLKKIPEVNDIFENLTKIHDAADEDDTTVRLSIDTKDRVKIGDFSRGGKNRAEVKAFDHDFSTKSLTPFGIMNVKEGTVDISITESKVTADFMVDRIEEYWVRNGFQNNKKILVLNADNGPENNSHRTQFIKRMVEFSVKYNVIIHLAYYPPYHSKYNPIERVWGALEQHWNGSLMNSVETVVKFAESMRYNCQHPTVTLVEQEYATGVSVDKKDMSIYELIIKRQKGLEKWFVSIDSSRYKEVLDKELLI